MLSQDKKAKVSPIKMFGDDNDSFRKYIEGKGRSKWITVERIMYAYLKTPNSFADVCQGIRLSKKMKQFMFAIQDFLYEEFNDYDILADDYVELLTFVKSEFKYFYPHIRIFDSILSYELDMHLDALNEEMEEAEYAEDNEEF